LNSYLLALEAAVRPIGFLSDSQFTWFGTPSQTLSAVVRRSLVPQAIREFLHYQLQQTLYTQFYGRGSPHPYEEETGWGQDDPDFVAAVAAANKGTGSVETGWTAREMRHGRVVIERRGLTLEVAPDFCAPRITEPLLSPIEVRLHVPNAKPNLSPGYYFITGDAPNLQADVQVRLYWHLTPQGAAGWVQYTTEALNTHHLPFHLKVLRAPQLFTRCDAGVLYLPRSMFATVRPLLADIYSRVGALLHEEVPAFTLPLAPGLALAESPGNESFGMHRCSLLAEGLLRSQTLGRSDPGSRSACILACWTEAGLQIERPYLNPGSQDIYEPFFSPVVHTGGAVSPIESNELMDRSACLEVATSVGMALAREAIWDRDRCTWLGAEVLSPGNVSYGTLSADVYSGTAGVGLFLAALWKVTSAREVRHAAAGAIRQSLARAVTPETNVLGLYTGTLGICWAGVSAALMLGDGDMVRDSVAQLRRCREDASKRAKQEWDLLTGQAGAILALLSLRRALRDDSLLEWAMLLAADLMARGERDGAGRLSWRGTRARSARALTGYSHGAAGPGIALLELGVAAGDSALQEAGLAAFSYERKWFDAERANWPDFRRNPGEPSGKEKRFSMAWCHGAPGIALSRLRAVQLAAKPELATELRAAVQATSQATTAMLHRPEANPCLCHGLMGNAEVLSLCAAGVAPSLVWRIAAHGCQTDDAGRERWRRGPQLNSSPGLMLGRAGIGQFYLRLFDSSIPSVLLPYP
jgi:hypothetical protein